MKKWLKITLLSLLTLFILSGGWFAWKDYRETKQQNSEMARRQIRLENKMRHKEFVEKEKEYRRTMNIRAGRDENEGLDQVR